MKLNKNSIGVKIYQYVWGEGLPNNLCNYFWKSILAYMLVPLVTIFQIMYYPASLIPVVKDEMGGERFSERLVGLLVIFAGIIMFSLGVFISSAWVTYQSETVMFDFYVLGGIFTLLFTFICIILMYSRLTHEKEGVVREYIKAKKGNYCPKIEWIDKK